MKVAVIGGGGFVGRHLCNYLAQHAYEVIATTRDLARVPVNADNITWLQLELLDSPKHEPDFAGVDCVVYLAARAHLMSDSTTDPLSEYRKINRDAALDIARSAAAQGVGRFIYLSSIGVNGIENNRPFREDDSPAPVEDYARSKLEAEHALAELASDCNMELVVLRPPLVYGSGAPGNFGRLLAAVEKGRWLPLAAVHNRRSFIAIENLVQVIEICIHHPRAANQLFLVADGEDVSSASLIRHIGVALGRPARLVYVPVFLLKLAGMLLGKSKEINRLCGSLQVDSARARQMLDWEPAVTMIQGLQNLRA